MVSSYTKVKQKSVYQLWKKNIGTERADDKKLARESVLSKGIFPRELQMLSKNGALEP
jgi:hypothetical protein